jgi:hypothetical protein
MPPLYIPHLHLRGWFEKDLIESASTLSTVRTQRSYGNDLPLSRETGSSGSGTCCLRVDDDLHP